jgi:hypothetical protein
MNSIPLKACHVRHQNGGEKKFLWGASHSSLVADWVAVMLRLLLKMLLLPTDLITSHVRSYLQLAGEVGARYLCTLRNRWLMYALSVLSMLLALIFGGVALLLWSAWPFQDSPHAWVLPALPSACFLLSGICWWWARQQRLPSLLEEIQTQVALDVQAIREANSV